ncbi:MAG: hypothetical protein M9894_34650 [Planctomycetes bacterium]|nr:hypothetical protein [Planctomycetota bacterium]
MTEAGGGATLADGAAGGDAAPAPPAPATRWPLALALALLLLLGGAAAWGNRAQHNPDGFCYLQLASHLVAGDVRASISGYWSPLFVWTLAPLLALGLEPLAAARLALLAWAAVGVLGVDRLARRLDLAPGPRALALVAATLWLADLATEVTTPDVAVGACLLHYAVGVLDPRLCSSRARAATTGALAGVSYLAKAYALPFVLVHLPLTLALRAALADDPREGARRAARTGAVALGALLVVALPWVAALSWRHERPTWSTVGGINLAATGRWTAPGQVFHPLEGLRTPPAPHLSVWETPEVLTYPDVPLDLDHRLGVLQANARKARDFMVGWDLLGLTLPALALAAGAAWLGRRRLPRDRLLWLGWAPLTFAVYLGGYVVVYVEERHVRPFLLPLGVLLVVGLCLEAARWAAGDDARRARRHGLALAALVCASSGVVPADLLARRAVQNPAAEVRGREAWLRALRDAGCRGPLAVVGLGWLEGQLWSFCLQVPFAGSAGLDVAPADLDAHGVATVIALRQGERLLDLGPGWVRVVTAARPEGDWLDTYVRR